MAFLEIRDLTFTYPNSGVQALDRLDLDAERGELIAVVGPNAAGKSTFALLLKGLLKPDSGTIRLAGRDRPYSGPDQGVGILFSNPENQLVTSIVQEDVAFGLEVMGVAPSAIQDRVGAVLEHLGIGHLKKRMPHLLSGGEQQMTALAGVLVLEPDILVLDEPTTYLDPDARAAVLLSLRDLAGQGKIIFHITHDMNEAAVADRVLLLDQGRIASHGSPEDLFNSAGPAGDLGIYPPFLMSLVMELRSAGMDVKWPQDPRSLAMAVKKAVKPVDGDTGGWDRVPPKTSAGGTALAFEQVYYSYGTGEQGAGPLLSGVNYSLDEGTVALVCGANGSGKSTLLQMSNGLITPDDGHVLVCGRQLSSWKKERGGIPGRVALLFQNPERQVFSSTVFEDIAFGPRNLGISADQIQKRVLKAARWVGLTGDVLDRPTHTLSGGQMRRTAVAGVLAMETGILVLDEPTDGLDPGGTREFYTAVRRYCDETGSSILMATHSVPEQVAKIDQIGHLEHGIIKSAGRPSHVLAGDRRTLPARYLPDHLILGEELAGLGVDLKEDRLDPERARGRILALTAG